MINVGPILAMNAQAVAAMRMRMLVTGDTDEGTPRGDSSSAAAADAMPCLQQALALTKALMLQLEEEEDAQQEDGDPSRTTGALPAATTAGATVLPRPVHHRLVVAPASPHHHYLTTLESSDIVVCQPFVVQVSNRNDTNVVDVTGEDESSSQQRGAPNDVALNVDAAHDVEVTMVLEDSHQVALLCATILFNMGLLHHYPLPFSSEFGNNKKHIDVTSHKALLFYKLAAHTLLPLLDATEDDDEDQNYRDNDDDDDYDLMALLYVAIQNNICQLYSDQQDAHRGPTSCHNTQLVPLIHETREFCITHIIRRQAHRGRGGGGVVAAAAAAANGLFDFFYANAQHWLQAQERPAPSA